MGGAGSKQGFTIIELLIAIMVIAILSSLVVVAYNGVQTKSRMSKIDHDLSQLHRAILLARESTGLTLTDITITGWTQGNCTSAGNNPAQTEPKNLPKTHICWTRTDLSLNRIAQAAGVNLDGLKNGDPNGNPYTLDENENTMVDPCSDEDHLKYFSNSGVGVVIWKQVAFSLPQCL